MRTFQSWNTVIFLLSTTACDGWINILYQGPQSEPTFGIAVHRGGMADAKSIRYEGGGGSVGRDLA